MNVLLGNVFYGSQVSNLVTIEYYNRLCNVLKKKSTACCNRVYLKIEFSIVPSWQPKLGKGYSSYHYFVTKFGINYPFRTVTTCNGA